MSLMWVAGSGLDFRCPLPKAAAQIDGTSAYWLRCPHQPGCGAGNGSLTGSD